MFFTNENPILTNVASIATIIAILGIVYGFIKKLWFFALKKYTRPLCLTEKEVNLYTKLYIKTRLQNEPVISNEKHKTYNINKFIHKYIDGGDNQYHWILGDTGTGKTSFMINLYFYYNCRIHKKYKLVFISLRNADAIDQILKSANETDPSKTVMLLDAFDESEIALNDIESAKRRIEELTKVFCKVIFSSRNHFFNNTKEEPQSVEVRRSVLLDDENYIKHYICPFSNYEIVNYLFRLYKLNFIKIVRAKKTVDRAPDLMARPLLLSYIDDLITEGQGYQFSTEIYKKLIDKWIDREIRFVSKTGGNGGNLNYNVSFWNFIFDVVKMMYDKGNYSNDYSISTGDLSKLCNKHNIEKEISKRPRTLLIRVSDDIFKFAHRSIFEFLLFWGEENNKYTLDRDEPQFASLTQYRFFMNEMNTDTEKVANRYDTTKNEKILFRKSIISGSTTAILVVFLVVLVFTNSFFISIRMPLRLLLLGIAFIIYPLVHFITDKLHRLIWFKIINKGFDISGFWFLLQTEPNNKAYLRFGTVVVGQNYYNIHMDAETYSVVYNKKNESLKIDTSKHTTKWFDDSIIDPKGKLYGTYQSARSDGTYLYGLHVLDLGGNSKLRPSKISGWFIDSTPNPSSHIRRGNKLMFRSKLERDEYARGLIRKLEIEI